MRFRMNLSEVRDSLCVLWKSSDAEGNKEILNCFDSLAVLFSRVVRDLQALPDGEVYRMVEFGCGDNPMMAVMTFAIAQIFKKKLSFLGLDINPDRISCLQQMILGAEDSFKEACRFQVADASDLS